MILHRQHDTELRIVQKTHLYQWTKRLGINFFVIDGLLPCFDRQKCGIVNLQ